MVFQKCVWIRNAVVNDTPLIILPKRMHGVLQLATQFN